MRGSSIEGIWIVLVPEGMLKVPLLARAGAGLYLLGFRNGAIARKFIVDKGLVGADPLMIVPANLAETLSYLDSRQVSGVLIDYDVSTNTYREAGLVY